LLAAPAKYKGTQLECTTSAAVPRRAEVADLVGREVEIPGTVFSNFTPGLTYK